MNPGRSERIQALAETAMAEKLGPLEDLPRAVQAHVREVYREFMKAYVEIVRIKDNRARDWLPESIRIDPEITEDMRHFFSDYQHITNEFLHIQAKIDNLKAIDRNRTPGLYEELVNVILSRATSENVMRKLAG
jgi:hypothetical protein